MELRSKSVTTVILLAFVGCLSARNIFELYLDCPHAVPFGENTLHGSIVLPPLNLAAATTLEVESSCSMDVHNSLKENQDYTYITWTKKSDHSGSASSTSFEASEVQKQLHGTCIIGHKLIEQAYKLRKSIICYDLICNRTDCKPELHYMSPIHACNLMKSCIVALGPYRIQVIFKRTFCNTGILVEGKCFRPDNALMSSVKPGLLELATVPTTCFYIAKEDESLKLVEVLEKVDSSGCTSNTYKGQGYYLCIAGGNSNVIRAVSDTDHQSAQLIRAIHNSPHGEDHDNVGDSFGAVRIAGALEVKVPHTESTANLKGIAFSGTPLYSSISAYIKDKVPKYVFSPGIIPNMNQSGCDKKAIPVVWSGMMQIPGIFEPINRCSVFCVLSGPGASCEAFAEGGIYNVSSPTCLVSKHNTFRTTDQQVNFVCQRVDQDIIVYCNGYKKIIYTKTLVIGQCIYTLTSVFSIFSGVAHSIAIELCVPGFHGWATVALIITFCFGWILIPGCTWFTLCILKFFAAILHSQSEENRFKQLLTKIKEEYEKTKGSMVCDVCKLECETQKELKAHKLSCPQEQCPYCFVHCEPSEAAFQAHYKVCQVTHRFSDELKKTVTQKPQRQGCYRTLNVFRYKSRCYIFTVWVLLLTIESVIWAASAEPEPLTPIWNDNAHGIGHHLLDTDLELDFSLLSSSRYTYRRRLINPNNKDQSVPIHVDIHPQTISMEVQPLGHWFDAELNVKTSFHCYGACSKYVYSWHTAFCHFEKDFQYENNWACNPHDCPGIGTGCTACGIYWDKFKAVGEAFNAVTIKYTRKVCVQFSEETLCRILDSKDCYVTRNFKICIIGTGYKFQQGDTLLFLGPMEGGGLIVRQWCTTKGQFGDSGDALLVPPGPHICPEYPGLFRKKCMCAQSQQCEYQGNINAGNKNLIVTQDSFHSFNTTDIQLARTKLEWSDPDGIIRDHINVILNKDIDFSDLAENPCKVSVQTNQIEGAWGSGVGFTLKCTISLTECGTFITSIKACDAAICYGATSVTLNRGQNTIHVTGKGGHSGSKFRCCHEMHCSTNGLLANAPHLDRVMGVDSISDNHVYDDGAPPCRVSCWFQKTGEWLIGLFHGNWMVVIVLIVLLIISLICLSFFCPARKLKRV
ncbi:glycoprotein [Lianghe virus]|nr:glycoprotein [Lianghe virus]